MVAPYVHPWPLYAWAVCGHSHFRRDVAWVVSLGFAASSGSCLPSCLVVPVPFGLLY